MSEGWGHAGMGSSRNAMVALPDGAAVGRACCRVGRLEVRTCLQSSVGHVAQLAGRSQRLGEGGESSRTRSRQSLCAPAPWRPVGVSLIPSGRCVSTAWDKGRPGGAGRKRVGLDRAAGVGNFMQPLIATRVGAAEARSSARHFVVGELGSGRSAAGSRCDLAELRPRRDLARSAVAARKASRSGRPSGPGAAVRRWPGRRRWSVRAVVGDGSAGQPLSPERPRMRSHFGLVLPREAERGAGVDVSRCLSRRPAG